MTKQKDQLKIGIALNYVNMIVGNLIPVFYTPIMLQLLGQNGYGLYKLSSTVTSYLSLMSLGLGTAITRYLIKARTEGTPEDEKKTLGLFVVIFQFVAALSLIVGTALTFNLDRWYAQSLNAEELIQMQILVFIMVCNTALSFTQTPYLSVVSSHEKFIFLQSMNILTTCLGPALNLIVLWLGFGSVGMAVSSLIISVISRVSYLVYVRKTVRIRPLYCKMPFYALREILGFSFWIFVGNIVGQLYNATDTVLIGMIPALATAGVAVYNVGGMFNAIVFSLTTGISSLLTPKTNKMIFEHASNRELTDFAIRIGRLQGYIICLLVTGFAIFGRSFICFYAGAEYLEAYWVALFMMVPNMIPLVQSVCLSVIVAQNKHKFRAVMYLIIAILNVVGTWFMMKWMGIAGAALMTGIALVIGQGFIMNWYYHKRTGLDMIHFWKQFVRLYLTAAVLCAVALLVVRGIDLTVIPLWIMCVVLYTVVYCVVCWVFVMNTYEKDLIRDPVKKIINMIQR